MRISASVGEATSGGHASSDINGGLLTNSAAETDQYDQMNTFRLTLFSGFLWWEVMIASKTCWCWRKDLTEFRGLTDRERAGFLLVLEWFENFRLRHELPADRDSAKKFWRAEVIKEDRPRESWQLEQWSDAIQWYLKWLEACTSEGARLRCATPGQARSGVLRRLVLSGF